MRKRTLFAFFLSIALCDISLAQVLKGRVLDEKGNGVPSATVRAVKNSSLVKSNADGSFELTIRTIPDSVEFSSVGFETYYLHLTPRNISDPKFEVVLLRSRKELSEVVVTGYGTARKMSVTGAVATVRGEELEDRAAGVHVTDSRSAKIRIRGVSSIKDSPKEPGTHRLIKSAVSGDAGSGILTAGEVNDFKKWKMWEDYTGNEFRTWSEYWGMIPKQRFSLQVTNPDRQPVINEPVLLLNKSTGDTLWKAVTDNTGKAELWAGFTGDSLRNGAYMIVDSRGNKLNHPSGFSNGINLLASAAVCSIPKEADIAFVVDATGSMGDEIEYMKMELEDVLRSTAEKFRGMKINLASVFYRDRGDEYLTRHTPFHDDPLKLVNFIKMQSAGGGGDYPEAVDDALQTALDSLQWNDRARTRLLFLVLDAPAHDYAKEKIRLLTLKAAAMGVRIIPVACSGTDKSTEFLLRSMALATNGTYTFLTDHSGVGGSHIKPTTDKYDVELLNDLLQRLIAQYLYARDCDDAVNHSLVEMGAVETENILSVKLYPNPTNGPFTIESKKEIRDIFITDFTGKILQRLSEGPRKGRWKVDISQYPAGVYLARYITKDNKWGAEKVVLLR